MARAVHRLAAEQHEACLRDGEHRDAVAGAEHQQPAGAEGLARNVDLAGHDEDAPLVVVGIEREDGAGRQHRLRVEAGVGIGGGRSLPVEGAHNNAHGLAVAREARQLAAS